MRAEETCEMLRGDCDVPGSTESHLLSSHGCLLQARAERSFSASDATVLSRNFRHAKSHSSLPPAAMALQ